MGPQQQGQPQVSRGGHPGEEGPPNVRGARPVRRCHIQPGWAVFGSPPLLGGAHFQGGQRLPPLCWRGRGQGTAGLHQNPSPPHSTGAMPVGWGLELCARQQSGPHFQPPPPPPTSSCSGTSSSRSSSQGSRCRGGCSRRSSRRGGRGGSWGGRSGGCRWRRSGGRGRGGAGAGRGWGGGSRGGCGR